MEGISSSMSSDFVLAAALALALQRQQNQGYNTAADTTMNDAASSVQRSPSTWTLRSADMSLDGPDFASTPILSQEHGVNSDIRDPICDNSFGHGGETTAFCRNGGESNTIEDALENDLELVNDEADRRAGIIRPYTQSTATPQSRRSRSRYGRRLKQPMNCTISTCLEETMASGTQLTTVSQRTDTRKSLKSREFWENMFELQSNWIQKVLSSSYSRSAFAAQVLECWKTLMKAYSSLSAACNGLVTVDMLRESRGDDRVNYARGLNLDIQSRPVDLQKCLQLYAVDAVKLLEHGIQRGYSEVATLMVEFINVVMSAFLKNSKHLCEFSSCWVQTREILRIICETPTSMNILCALSTTIDELKLKQTVGGGSAEFNNDVLYFLQSNVAVLQTAYDYLMEIVAIAKPSENEDHFMSLAFLCSSAFALYLKTRATDAVILRDDGLTAYIVNQFNDLATRVANRMLQCQHRKVYGLLF